MKYGIICEIKILEVKMRKFQITTLIVLLLSFLPMIFSQNATDSQKTEKDSKFRKYIELLDSGDYVVILRNNKKVRVKMKPEITESDLIWLYVKKKSGQYNRESIHKSLVDFEKTEEYNSKIDKNRNIRNTEIERKKQETMKLRAAERIAAGKINNNKEKTPKVYTASDLASKKSTSKSLDITEIENLAGETEWLVVIDSESDDYERTEVSVQKKNGEVILVSNIKAILELKESIDVQIAAYEKRIQDIYDQGTKDGDKYKYSSQIVEIQNIVQSFKSSESVLSRIVLQFPPAPESKSPADN